LVAQYLSWFDLVKTLETVETESLDTSPEIPGANPDDQLEDLISIRAKPVPFKERVDGLAATRLRRPAQSPSPKAPSKRPAGKPQTPLQKRPTKPPKSGRSTPTSSEKQSRSPVTVITSPKKRGRNLLETEDLSDIVVTDIFEKPKKRR
jgi:hypothetical protein